MNEYIFENLTPEEKKKFFNEINNEKYLGLKIGLAERTTNQELIRMLAKHANEEVKIRLAGNKSTPSDILMGYIKNEEGEIASVAAANPSIDPSAFKKEWKGGLFRKDRQDIKLGVAVNPSTTVESLKYLIKTGNQQVKENIAMTTSSNEILKKLYKEGDKNIIYFMTANPNITSEFLKDIYVANKGNYRIVKGIIINPNSKDLLETIYENNKDNTNLKEMLVEFAGPELARKIASENRDNENLLSNMCRNKNVPLEMLKDFNIPVEDVYITYHPMNSQEELKRIVNEYSNDSFMLNKIAEYPNTPTELLNEIYEIAKRNGMKNLFSTLTQNHNISGELKDDIIENSEALNDPKNKYNYIDAANPEEKSKLIMVRMGIIAQPLEESSLSELKRIEAILKEQNAILKENEQEAIAKQEAIERIKELQRELGGINKEISNTAKPIIQEQK